MRPLLPLLTAFFMTAAADTPVLENTGKPIALPFKCDAQQLDEAGLTCTSDDPCHVYLELTGIEAAGTKLFLTGNLHTRVTTLSSIALESSDAGRTWTEPVERMPQTSFEGIQFIDFQRGWIAGESVQPLPRDPFFLITDDGGRTWRNQPLFDDDHPGAIESFWFESHDNGSLILDTGLPGDRHELYETTDGGSHWNLRRRSAAPIPLRGQRARDATAGWRFQADSRAGAYRIESTGAAATSPAASFLIEVGLCRGE